MRPIRDCIRRWSIQPQLTILLAKGRRLGRAKRLEAIWPVPVKWKNQPGFNVANTAKVALVCRYEFALLIVIWWLSTRLSLKCYLPAIWDWIMPVPFKPANPHILAKSVRLDHSFTGWLALLTNGDVPTGHFYPVWPVYSGTSNIWMSSLLSVADVKTRWTI